KSRGGPAHHSGAVRGYCRDPGRRPGDRVLAAAREPQVARIRRPRVASRRSPPTPGIDRGPGAGDVDAEVQVGTTTATGVAAAGDYLAAADRLAGAHIDRGEVRVACAESVWMIEDDGLPEAGVDRIGPGKADYSVAGCPHVLVAEPVVPAVVPVVVEVIAAARRLGIPTRERWVDAVAAETDRAVETADRAVGRVVRAALVADRGDHVIADVRPGQEWRRDTRRRGAGRRRRLGPQAGRRQPSQSCVRRHLGRQP